MVLSRTSVKCRRYPFWDAVRLGLGGRSLPSCWQARVPVGRVAMVLLREHPSSYDVFSFGMQSFAHVHVPARVFLGECLLLCVGSAFGLDSFATLPFEPWDVLFPFDRSMGGVRHSLFLAPHGRTSSSFPFPSPSMHLRFDRVSTRISLSPSLGSARPKRGSHALPPPSFLPALFLCATNPKGTKHSVSFPHRRGGTVSVPSRTFRIDGPRSSGWGRVVGGRSETRSHGGADPHPSPPKILPRRTTHPRPNQVS